MNLTDRLTRLITHAKNEVTSYIRPPSRSPQPTTSSPQTTTQIFDLTGDSPELSSTKHPKPAFRTAAVPALIDADDEEHRAHEFEGKNGGKKKINVHPRTPSATSITTPSVLRDGRSIRKREFSTPEERRALGVVESTPKDAVKVLLPGSGPQTIMPSHKPPSTGLRIVDTFNPPPRAGKAAVLQNSVEKKGVRATKSHFLPNDHIVNRENNHVVPNKKQRLGEPRSSIRRIHSTISIDSAEDDQGFLDRHKKPDTLKRGSARASNDVEIYDVSGHNADPQSLSNPASGMGQTIGVAIHKNRVQMDAMLDSSPNPAAGERPRQSADSHFHSNPAGPTQVRIDDSPDELQIDMTTVQPTVVRPRLAKHVRKRPPLKPGDRLSHEEGKVISMHDLSRLVKHTYALKSVPGYEGLDASESELVLCPDLQHFWIFLKRPLLDNVAIINLPLSKITKIDFAAEHTKVILFLSHNVIKHNKLYLDFKSLRDLADFSTNIQGKENFNLVTRSTAQLDRAFLKFSDDIAASKTDDVSMPHIFADLNDHTTEHTNDKRVEQSRDKSHRLIDKLDSPDPVTSVIPATTTKRGADFVRSVVDSSAKIRQTRQSAASTATRSPYFNEAYSARVTRFNGSRNFDIGISKPKPDAAAFKVSSLIKVKSDKPLTLHGPLKKSESLTDDDFERLNEDEFLNDNLISFFLLYLQKHTNYHFLKRIYFFNTFFYSTLTKDTKGRANINYDAVARWTKNVNLFSRDFVVVPVNENYHWFVMIICNLPALSGRGTGADLLDDQDHDEAGYESDHENENHSRVAVAIHEATTESFQELSLEDEVGQIDQPREAAASSRKKRKNIVRMKRRYDVRKPVIITLDSLDSNRSATATQLKKYIASLAADPTQNHKTFEVDASSIPGMTAKEIPHQGNFSDCGLYLCMYMEQFVREPDAFVRKVLQRENNGPRWPHNITSRRLRERLATLLNKLYEQQLTPSTDLVFPELGSILIDMLPAEDEIAEILPSQNGSNIAHEQVLQRWKDWEDGKLPSSQPRPGQSAAYHAVDKTRQQHPTCLVQTPKPSLPIEVHDHGYDSPVVVETPSSFVAESVVLSDDDENVTDKKGVTIENLVVAGKDSPLALAARLAEQRSSQTYNHNPRAAAMEQMSRDTRSDSVSTEYLAGNASYRTSDMTIKRARSPSSSIQRSPRIISPARHFLGPGTDNNKASSTTVPEDEPSTIDLDEAAPPPKRILLSPEADAAAGTSVEVTTMDDNVEEMLV